MTDKDERLLIDNGWTVECESPFEIFHAESGSRATRDAADLVLWSLEQECQNLTTELPKFEFQKHRWDMMDLDELKKLSDEGWELIHAYHGKFYIEVYFKLQIV